MARGTEASAATPCVGCEATASASSRPALGAWLGYAFVAFRDTQEAEQALELFDGLRVAEGRWTMRVKWAEAQHQGRVLLGRKLGARLAPGADPPLGEQLFPSSLQGRELATQLWEMQRAAGLSLDSGTEAWIVVELVKAHFRRTPRLLRHAEGAPVPERILAPLLRELRALRWPPVPHRSGMQAAEYLVLFRGKANDGYDEILALLEGLLRWADPDFGCNRIAVTKDFQGSPHIDGSDATFQYALSLGDFDAGGELCVQSHRPGEAYVVNTHNRMARVDGRFVHWVRGFGGGDRYSLIFFSTSPVYATRREWAVDTSFAPRTLGDADGDPPLPS